MLKEIKKFFKNKFNLIMTIFQAIALIFVIFVNLWSMAIAFVLFFEGCVFITLGIKTFANNKILDENLEKYGIICNNDDEMIKLHKKNKIAKSSNILQGILFICMGLTIIFIAVF